MDIVEACQMTFDNCRSLKVTDEKTRLEILRCLGLLSYEKLQERIVSLDTNIFQRIADIGKFELTSKSKVWKLFNSNGLKINNSRTFNEDARRINWIPIPDKGFSLAVLWGGKNQFDFLFLNKIYKSVYRKPNGEWITDSRGHVSNLSKKFAVIRLNSYNNETWYSCVKKYYTLGQAQRACEQYKLNNNDNGFIVADVVYEEHKAEYLKAFAVYQTYYKDGVKIKMY
jgi:hypothetical protein